VWLACFARPPDLAGRPAILDEAIRSDGEGRRAVGRCWFRKDPGLSLLHVEGDPFTMGYAGAALTEEYLEEQEEALIATVRGFFPSRIGFAAITLAVLVNNRDLPSHVLPEHQLEILGISSAGKDPFPEYGPRYHRILNYHAAHDISHWVLDRPVAGCTAFAAAGPWTRDGRLLVGRNFDFEGGDHFDRNKVVTSYRPEKGCAFISVSWPGMAGAVTGLNEAGLYGSINGAHSADRASIGTPSSLVLRRVLQEARTLDEGAAIIRQAKVFVSDSYLLAEGRTGRAIVVEKSPGRTEVREMEDGRILQANHFECPGFAADAGNLESLRIGTSSSRRRRVAELLDEHRGALDPPLAARILRDRRGPGGKELGAGNRKSLNPLIATHSVIADPAGGILWISRGPHQLGRYEAVSIARFGEPAADPIPEDEALAAGLHERVHRGRDVAARAERALAAGPRLPGALEAEVRDAIGILPRDPALRRILARHLESGGARDEALRELRAALEADPAFPSEREEIETAIHRLEN